MDTYNDLKIRNNSLHPLLAYAVLTSIFCIFYMFYHVFFVALITKKYFMFLPLGFCSFIFFIYFINTICHLVSGGIVVYQIENKNKNLILHTIHAKKIVIAKTDILCLNGGQVGHKIHLSHLFKTGKQGLTLFLKDGRYFRISPHMERISELQKLLEDIAHKNNLAGSFEEPKAFNLTRQHFLFWLPLFSLFGISFSYFVNAFLQIIKENHHEILEILVNTLERLFLGLTPDELANYHRNIKYYSHYINLSIKSYPYLYPSFLISISIIIGLFIRGLRKNL